MEKIIYSIVIPVYKSGAWMPELVERIGKVMEPYGSFELLLVNDCSPDGNKTWQAICECCRQYRWVKGINLLINTGQFRATICGFEHAQGDYIITMDDDLQQPPEELPKLIEAMSQDDDTLCYIGKFDAKKHAWYRLIGTKCYQLIEKYCYNKPLTLTTTSFRIMRRSFVKALLEIHVNNPQISPLISSMTPKLKNVMVNHQERPYGSSGYGFFKLAMTAYECIINSSTVPLRLFSIIGLLSLLFSIILSIIYLCNYFILGNRIAGFTTIALLILFFGGLLVMGIGIIGEYLARIISQITRPKLYAVKETVNLEAKIG